MAKNLIYLFTLTIILCSVSWADDNCSINCGNGTFTGLTVSGNPSFYKAAPSFATFGRTEIPGTAKVSVGMLGFGEANLSYNMDYTDSVHRYYDATKNAIWFTINGGAWGVQYAQSGLPADIWQSAGYPYLLYGNARGQIMLGSTMTTIANGGYTAQFTLPRPGGSGSIAGVTDLVLEGAKTTGVSGTVSLNLYNPGAVMLAKGGGNVGVGTITVPLAKLHVAGDILKSSSVPNTGGGLLITHAEGIATLSGASTDIAWITGGPIPFGAITHGCQFRVDDLITSGDNATSWSASYSGGSSTLLATWQEFDKNTKTNAITTPEKTTGITGVTIVPNGGTFSGGVVRAVCYYETMVAMSDKP